MSSQQVWAGAVGLGVVAFLVLCLLYARVGDSMDGIRAVYIFLFSAALSLLTGVVGGVVRWLASRKP